MLLSQHSQDSPPPVDCVAFILIQDDRFLAEKRSRSKKTDSGIMAIPGGHVEPGESLEAALHPEINEELGVVPIDSRFICSLEHRTRELQRIRYFVVASWNGNIRNHEAESLVWFPLANPNTLDLKVDRMAIASLVDSLWQNGQSKRPRRFGTDV